MIILFNSANNGYGNPLNRSEDETQPGWAILRTARCAGDSSPANGRHRCLAIP